MGRHELLVAEALAVLRPPPKLRLSEWIQRTLLLPEGVTALPGNVRLWPFQHEIADAIGDPKIERVTVVKPVRVGYTMILTGALGSYCANDPATILTLLPTEADARDYVVSEVEPIFAATPELAKVLGNDTEEGGRNTLMARRFPGGSIKFIAAKAPRNLRRHTARVLVIDEADAMEINAEGNVLELAENRTLSFADRKIVMGSTPIFEATSHVLRSYAASDQRVYEVPCPDCGHRHEIGWKDIQWPESEPEKAAYVCPECGTVVEERFKAGMVKRGGWRTTRPEIEGHAGFRFNALITPHVNASWGKLAAKFAAAKDDPGALQTFVNTILGQGWKDNGAALDDDELINRRELFGLESMPEDVLAITCGVDVQHDRLEATFLGWAQDGTVFALAHTVVWGRWDDDTMWAELDAVLKSSWDHPLGGKIKIDATCIDSGDGTTMERVYRFAFARRRVYAVKGEPGERRPWIEASKKLVRGGRLFLVGVHSLKSYIFDRLGRAGSVRFSENLPPVWFEQLVSQRIAVRYSRGSAIRVFEDIPGRRQEALDCVVYAWAARGLVNVNWNQRRADLAQKRPEWSKPKRPTVIRSNWMER